MKHLLIVSLTVVLLIGVLAVPAMAAVYSETFTNDFSRDFTTVINHSDGQIRFDYADFVIGVEACSTIVAPSGSTGRAYVCLMYYDLEVETNNSTAIVDGLIQTSVVLDTSYATKANFYALRRVGTANVWDYTYQTEDHGPYPW